MSDRLRIDAEQGGALEIARTVDGELDIYGSAGGVRLNRTQVALVVDWLAEESRAPFGAVDELDRIERHVAELLSALSDAWWLRAADAYGHLNAWLAGRAT